jgi:hypothetical protein
MVALSSRQIAYVEGIREKRKVGNSAYSFKKRLKYAWTTLECIFHLRVYNSYIDTKTTFLPLENSFYDHWGYKKLRGFH